MTDFNQKRLDQVRSRIVHDLKDHVVTQQLNQGPFRHFLCKKPGDSNCYFEVTTIPGRLFISGDMGTCVWERSLDMLEWARGASYDYAATKVSQEINIKEFSSDAAHEWISQTWTDGDIDTQTKDKLLKALTRLDNENVFYDTLIKSDCETHTDGACEIFTYHYLWQFEAIQWLLRKLDAGDFQCETQSSKQLTAAPSSVLTVMPGHALTMS